MKIAFDLRRIGNPGIGRYMKCLVEAVLRQGREHDYLLLLPPDAPQAINSGAANATRIIPRCAYYSVREQIELPRILRRHRVDLLHAPHFLLPLSLPCPAVVTIHDVIYLACRQDLPSAWGRLYYRTMMHASVHLARKVITDSTFSKLEIVKYLHADREKLVVIYPAVDPSIGHVSDRVYLEYVLSKHGISGDYVFYTGIYKTRKNHVGLLRAFGHYLSCGGSANLVIAGPISEGVRHLRSVAEQLGFGQRVIFTGYIADRELCALYSAARVYACPSLYEGFGFTVLEAMACGTPVVCSDAASLPEVAGDAALYADANNPAEFGEALNKAATDDNLRRELVCRGWNNVRRFSWDQSATSCLQMYEEAVGRGICFPSPLAEVQ